MIEHGAVKIGTTKLLGTIISPGFAILALGGIIVWKFWDNKQQIGDIREHGLAHQKTLDNVQTKIEVLSAQIQNKIFASPQKTSTHKNQSSKPKLAIFKQILEDNLDLRKAIV